MGAQTLLIEKVAGDLICPVGAGFEASQCGFHIFEIKVDRFQIDGMSVCSII